MGSDRRHICSSRPGCSNCMASGQRRPGSRSKARPQPRRAKSAEVASASVCPVDASAFNINAHTVRVTVCGEYDVAASAVGLGGKQPVSVCNRSLTSQLNGESDISRCCRQPFPKAGCCRCGLPRRTCRRQASSRGAWLAGRRHESRAEHHRGGKQRPPTCAGPLLPGRAHVVPSGSERVYHEVIDAGNSRIRISLRLAVLAVPVVTGYWDGMRSYQCCACAGIKLPAQNSGL